MDVRKCNIRQESKLNERLTDFQFFLTALNRVVILLARKATKLFASLCAGRK